MLYRSFWIITSHGTFPSVTLHVNKTTAIEGGAELSNRVFNCPKYSVKKTEYQPFVDTRGSKS
jgi:hypothetical protein